MRSLLAGSLLLLTACSAPPSNRDHLIFPLLLRPGLLGGRVVVEPPPTIDLREVVAQIRDVFGVSLMIDPSLEVCIPTADTPRRGEDWIPWLRRLVVRRPVRIVSRGQVWMIERSGELGPALKELEPTCLADCR